MAGGYLGLTTGWSAFPDYTQLTLSASERREVFKGRSPGLEVFERRIGKEFPGAGPSVPGQGAFRCAFGKECQALGITHRQGLQQDRPNGGEDGRVGADP
jgi:hypothetical protein